MCNFWLDSVKYVLVIASVTWCKKLVKIITMLTWSIFLPPAPSIKKTQYFVPLSAISSMLMKELCIPVALFQDLCCQNVSSRERKVSSCFISIWWVYVIGVSQGLLHNFVSWLLTFWISRFVPWKTSRCHCSRWTCVALKWLLRDQGSSVDQEIR